MFDYLRPQLIPTLALNNDETRRARDEAVARVKDVYTPFETGDLLARVGQPLTPQTMDLLELEHKLLCKSLLLSQRICYSLATLGMFVALLTLCGVYVLAYERQIIDNMRQLPDRAGTGYRRGRPGHAGRHRQPAGGIDSTALVRHDGFDRLPPGIGAAVFGRAGVDRRGLDRPGPVSNSSSSTPPWPRPFCWSVRFAAAGN